jgi:hypothetical protein
MAAKILVPVKRRDRIEEIVPYIEKVAEPSGSVVFLIHHPVSGFKWLQAYCGIAQCGLEKTLAVANRQNDYLIDREKQRSENYTGMRGIREEDIAIQENLYGPMVDRTKEHLGTSDTGVIALRRRLLTAVRKLQAGQEPPEPRRSNAYRVHPIADLARRDVSFEGVARAAIPMSVGALVEA